MPTTAKKVNRSKKSTSKKQPTKASNISKAQYSRLSKLAYVLNMNESQVLDVCIENLVSQLTDAIAERNIKLV